MNATETKLTQLAEWLRQEDTLVFCIGNNGRQDDGLAWAFGEQLEDSNTCCAKIVYRYQLQVEDVILISEYPRVLFVDASKKHYLQGFTLQTCSCESGETFTTHLLPPGVLLQLAMDLEEVNPEALCVWIGGEAWGLGLGLSAVAQEHLDLLLSELQ